MCVIIITIKKKMSMLEYIICGKRLTMHNRKIPKDTFLNFYRVMAAMMTLGKVVLIYS